MCGTACCQGDHRECVEGRCVVECPDTRPPCGDPASGACCDAQDVCYLGSCRTPGQDCTGAFSCPDGEFCDFSIGKCLPEAPGQTCEYQPTFEDFEHKEKWSWQSDPQVVPGSYQVMQTPMVANLTDDNGDGKVDENDIPDIVFTTFSSNDYWSNGVIRAISGDDGHRIWPTSAPPATIEATPGGELALADVDPNSPGVEIMACTESNQTAKSSGHLMILSSTGSLLRTFDTKPNDVPCGFDAPAVADMDHDGVPEIAVRGVVAHADGTVILRLAESLDTSVHRGTRATIANMDSDADLELIHKAGVYNLDGTDVWQGTTGDRIAIGDLDLNGTPEIVAVRTDAHAIIALNGQTGAAIWGPHNINPADASNPNETGGGPVTIANFDDDPNPEIAFAGGFAYRIFEHDGSPKWDIDTTDHSSRQTGSSVFDFEGDGVAEVLYNDERTFYVMRGPDGSFFHRQCNTSGTLSEYPVVVDVDNDGSAEIVLMENNYNDYPCRSGLPGAPNGHGIHVFGHPTNQWVRTRRIWNQHTYHVTNIEEDGTVPTHEEENWLNPKLNNFRQNVQPDGVFSAPDLVLEDLQNGCTSTVSVRVVNRGRAGAPAGVPVTLYRHDGSTWVKVARQTTTHTLLAGAGEVIVFTNVEASPQFRAVLNDPEDSPLNSLNECRPDNNDAEVASGCVVVE